MSSNDSLAEKLNLASEAYLSDVPKEDFAEEILNLFRADDHKGMNNLFRAYADFLLRSKAFFGSSSVESEAQILARAKRNLGFMSYAADLMNEGSSVFEVIEKAKKTKLDERKTGLVAPFFHDSIADYQLVSLPGYRTLYNGALYSKAWLVPDEQNTRLLSFLLLRRYTYPSEKDIMDCLQQAAADLSAPNPNGPDGGSYNTLEQTIAQEFDAQLKLDLLFGKEESLNKLTSKVKQFVKKTQVLPGQQFLDLKYSLVPEEFIKSNQAKGNIRGLNWYGLALSSPELQKHPGLGLRWSLQQLPYANALPEREKISLNEISINDQKDAKEVIDALYTALATPNHFAQVLDASDLIKEEAAFNFVKFLKELKEEEKIKSQELAQQYSLFGNKSDRNQGKAN